MAGYYLPEQSVERIQRLADPIPAEHHTLLIVREKSIEVIRGR
jgi:hypothetical protein